METIILFLIFCQALGALVGAATTVWGEISYLRALRDGEIDRAERAHLQIIAHGLRFGLTLLLIASLGLVIAAYWNHALPQPAITSSYWALIALSLLVVYSAWALSRKRLSFALGSAIAFSAWWFLAYLTIGSIPDLSFTTMLGFFVIATGIFYGMLQYVRMLTRKTN